MNWREIKVFTVLNPPIHENGILVDLFSSLPCTSFFVVLNFVHVLLNLFLKVFFDVIENSISF